MNVDVSDTTHSIQTTKPSISHPSLLWCLWKTLRGTRGGKLRIPDADLHNKWVIITGGNSGIGREAALQFSKWGANVVLGCRQPPPHEPHPNDVVRECKNVAEAAGHNDTVHEWWECNMADLASVEAFGKRWLAEGHPLDILANNAGIGGFIGKPILTTDGFEIVHQVNFLAHVLLTLHLLPSLKRAPHPRVICTTSCMQFLGRFDLSNANSSVNSYPCTKLYFQTWLTELQYRMSQHADYQHVSIIGVHPGYVKTNIWIAPREGHTVDVIERVLLFVLEYVGVDSQQGSLAITNAATAMECGWESKKVDEPESGRNYGRYMNRIWEETPMPQTRDPECRSMLWEFVNRELKVEGTELVRDLGG